MKLNSQQHVIAITFLVAVFLLASLATAELPGPTSSLPPNIPTPPLDSDYDYVKVVPKITGDTSQLEMGTPGKDKIIEYGATGNVTEIISGDTGDDWILQVGGDQNSILSVQSGDGNDTVYQFGVKGDNGMFAKGGIGNQIFIQVGGQGTNTMTILGGQGTAYIEQYGGNDHNTIQVCGSNGDDTIKIYGGPANDIMIYSLTTGNDLVTIKGGVGRNTLDIYTLEIDNFKLLNDQGRVLFQLGSGGSTITVAKLQQIRVLNNDYQSIYTYSSSVSAAIGAFLLLGN